MGPNWNIYGNFGRRDGSFETSWSDQGSSKPFKFLGLKRWYAPCTVRTIVTRVVTKMRLPCDDTVCKASAYRTLPQWERNSFISGCILDYRWRYPYHFTAPDLKYFTLGTKYTWNLRASTFLTQGVQDLLRQGISEIVLWNLSHDQFTVYRKRVGNFAWFMILRTLNSYRRPPFFTKELSDQRSFTAHWAHAGEKW